MCKFLDNLEVLANLNKSLDDELNQPTSFLAACTNKKSENPIKPKTQENKKLSGLGILKNPFLSEPCVRLCSQCFVFSVDSSVIIVGFC